MPFDQDVQANRDALMPDLLADFGDAWGGKWATFTILPIIYETDAHRGIPHWERAQRLRFAATSLSMVGLTTYLMKAAVGRERPNEKDNLSFPSGHTSISFGVAEVIRTLYGNLWGIPFYGAALITGLSRIHDNKHYLSDVVAGASLGVGLVRGFRPSWQLKSGLALSWHVAPPGTVTALIRF
ncbi:MAG: phosphatase PAP2 family protein [Fidelibacterota bacterium]|nr:MAG: phosphatase PAP2 family protein [Candidatus Neomarinimicrobiota bacterium]